MKKLSIALIGQGRSGRDIHGAFLKTERAKEQFEVIAITDRRQDRRERAAAEFGCPVYESIEAMIQGLEASGKRPDLVVNASYSQQHHDTTLQLLNQGYSVLCEKPVARSVKELDEMVAAAEKNHCYFGVFQQSRFAPYYVKVKEIIDSGVLGRLIDIDIQFNGFSRRWDWQTLQSFNGGSLRNTGPHPLDQALNILNAYDQMPQVFCKMDRVNTFGDAEDYVKLILTMPDKPLIDLTISCCDAFPCFTYKIHGQKGGLKGDMQHIEWKYFDPQQAPHQELTTESLSKEDGTPAYCTEKLEWSEHSWEGDPNGAFDVAVEAYYQMVYNHLVYQEPLAVTVAQVRQQVAVYEEAHRQNPMSVLDLA